MASSRRSCLAALGLWPMLLDASAREAEAVEGGAAPTGEVSVPIRELLLAHGKDGAMVLSATPEIGWERVTVQGPRLEPRFLRTGLSRLLDYRWEALKPGADTDGLPRYRLTPGPRVRTQETELLRRTLEAGAEPLIRLARYAARGQGEIDRLGALPPDQRAQDPALTDATLKMLRAPADRAALGLLLTLTREQLVDLLAYERYFLPWSGMNPRQQDLAKQVVGDPTRFKPDKDVAWLQQFGLILYAPGDPISGRVSSFGAGLGGANGVYASLRRGAAPVELLPVRGSPYAARGTAPQSRELDALPPPAEFRPRTDATWGETLQELARHIPLSIFSDDYARAVPSTATETDSTAAPANLAEWLDQLCRQHSRIWWSEEGTLYFRSRSWFVERLFEVPPPVLELLQAQVSDTGRVPASAITALCGLTERQLEGLTATANASRGAVGRMMRDRSGPREAWGYLQIWSQLDERQRAEALSPGGLPYSRLRGPQQEAFLRLLLFNRGRSVLEQLKNVRYRVEQSLPERGPTPDSPWLIRLEFSYLENAPLFARLAFSFRRAGEPGRSP